MSLVINAISLIKSSKEPDVDSKGLLAFVPSSTR